MNNSLVFRWAEWFGPLVETKIYNRNKAWRRLILLTLPISLPLLFALYVLWSFVFIFGFIPCFLIDEWRGI